MISWRTECLRSGYVRLGWLLAVALFLTACDRQDGEKAAATVAGHAARIISLAPNLTELVYTAGAGDRLVGVVEYSNFPEAALSLPRIGDAFRLDFEAIVGLAPDLVLAWGSGTPTEVREQLREMGYRVVSLDAAGLDDIGLQIETIGKLAGTSAVADAAATEYSNRLRELRKRYRDADRVDVFYQISAQPLFTITGKHVISEAIDICGGHNVFADIDGLSPAVSPESVIAAEPDVIVAGRDKNADGGVDELRAQWAAWTSIPAVRNGKVFTVDADRMHRSTTRILGAVDELCVLLDEARANDGAPADLSVSLLAVSPERLGDARLTVQNARDDKQQVR